MANVFVSSWIIWLDKSIFIWHSMCMCPDLVFFPKKPHSFDNEHHIVCFAKSGIPTQIDLVEGKNCPNQMEAQIQQQRQDCWATASFVTTRQPDSAPLLLKCAWFGRFVLKGIMDLKKRRIFVVVLIKKLQYWPTFALGTAMDSPFNKKQVGKYNEISGVLGEENILFGLLRSLYVLWRL